MEKEYAAIKRQAAVLAVPATFAQSAKIERQAIALDKEIEKLRSETDISNISPVLRGTQRVIRECSVWHARLIWGYALLSWGVRRPVVYVPAELAYPLGGLLRMFSHQYQYDMGAVTLGVWMTLCHRGGDRTVDADMGAGRGTGGGGMKHCVAWNRPRERKGREGREEEVVTKRPSVRPSFEDAVRLARHS